MRKTLLFATMAAMLAGCANHETVEIANDNSISFNTYVGKNTRADVTNSSLQKFYVYGGHDGSTVVFNGTAVNKTAQGWIPEESKYWVSGATYRFAAIAPTPVSASFDQTNLTITDYTPGDDDLVAAVSAPMVAKSSDNDGVQLNFQHALAKVQVSFVTKGGSTGVTFNVSDVKLENVINKGTMTAGYGQGTEIEWETGTSKGSYSYTLTENKGLKYMIPQTLGDDVVLSFSVSAVGIEENEVAKEFSIPVKAGTVTAWEMGSAYNYTINLNSAFGIEEIEFTVEEAPDWNDINLEGTTGGITPAAPQALSNPVKIDFGSYAETEDNTWNSITEVNPTNVSLFDSEGNETAVLLSVEGFTQSYTGAGSEPELPIFAKEIEWPRLVWKDSFSIDGEKEKGDVGPGTITISGFNPEQKVNITVLCARWNAGVDARITEFTLISNEGKSEPVEVKQGLGRNWSSGDHSPEWNAFEFDTLTHTFSNVTPKADGTIEIEVKGIDTHSAADAHVSAMVITPVAE